MILGVGTDLLSMERMRGALNHGGEPFLHRVYTDGERRQAALRDRPECYYATRFAAKEAVFKALGAAWQEGIALGEIEVLADEKGAPFVTLHGETARIAARRGISSIWISLSYEEEYAIALAVAEGREEERGM